ncbi:MAG: hypothetical protein K8T25_13780 [Planctomycetia bacterium]|nr:hypothetical protein [Planctomycetia bacterium]
MAIHLGDIMVKAIGLLGVMTTTVGVFAFGTMAVMNMFRTTHHRKEGVPLYPRLGSRFNLLFRPSQLTDRGLAARKKVLYATVGMVLCLVAELAIGLGTGVMK